MDRSTSVVVLTRFNLPSLGHEGLVRAQPSWLERRFLLFQQYCLPSLRRQTDDRFRWIIYFDPASPGWLKERVAGHVEADSYVAIERESVSREELVDDVRRVARGSSADLITVNVDNDDAVASNFLARLRALPVPAPRTALYLEWGLVRTSTGLYLCRDTRNAFCAVRESWTDPVTCWADWHNRLDKHMPAVTAGGQPGWLQVVHGQNVSNRIRGRLVAPAQYRRLFPVGLDGLAEPGSVELRKDRWVKAPTRSTQLWTRRMVKNGLFALAGKDGLDRVKALRRSMRAH